MSRCPKCNRWCVVWTNGLTVLGVCIAHGWYDANHVITRSDR